MEIITTKPWTRGHTGAKLGYLGTTADKTPAHRNPGKAKYMEAKARHDTKAMKKYRVYMVRDLRTFGNLNTSHGTKGLNAQIKRIMSHNRRKVIAREFIIAPSPNDHVDANNPDSVYHFQKYVQLFINRHFGDRFKYYAVIQPDSKRHAHIHCHLVVLSDTIGTGRAMAAHYYKVAGKYSYYKQHRYPTCRLDLARTTRAYNRQFNDYPMSMPTTQRVGFKLTQDQKRIVDAVLSAKNNIGITSRKSFAQYLAQRRISAKFKYNRKYKSHSGWKFKYNNSQWYKASRLSKGDGASEINSTNIAKILSSNRKLKASLKFKHQHAKEKSSAYASSKLESSAYSVAGLASASKATNASTSIRQLDLDALMLKLQRNGQQDMGTQLTIQPNTNNEAKKRKQVHQHYQTAPRDRSRIDAFIAGIKAYSQRIQQNLRAMFKRYRDKADHWLKQHGLKLHPLKESKSSHSDDSLISAFRASASGIDNNMPKPAKKPDSSSSAGSVGSKADSLEADQQSQRSEFIKRKKSKAASRAAKRRGISSSGPDWQ